MRISSLLIVPLFLLPIIANADAEPKPVIAKDKKAMERAIDDIRQIYQRYILNLNSDSGDGWQDASTLDEKRAYQSRKKELEEEKRRLKRNYLTTAFQAKFQKIVEETDADPVVCSQDSGDDWVEQISITNVNLLDDHGSATVTLGKKYPQQVQRLNVGFKKVLGAWRIDSVEKSPKE